MDYLSENFKFSDLWGEAPSCCIHVADQINTHLEIYVSIGWTGNQIC